MRLILLGCFLPAALAAQVPDTARVAHPIPATDSALRLPVDHASDLLSWMSGGGLDLDGVASWHGFLTQNLGRVTDGIRWASTRRSSGAQGLGSSPVFLESGLNGIARGEVGFANGGPAALLYTTRSGTDRWGVEGSAEDGSILRADGGTGNSRFEAAVGGPLTGSFRFRAAGTLLGRRSAPTGVDYSGSPFYRPTGIDTTMRFPDSAALPDSIDADVQRFGATSNIPYSPQSSADWTVRLDGHLGGVTVWAHWLGTRSAERSFNYLDIANPLQSRGANRSGDDLAAGATLALTAGLRLEGSLSLQHERSEEGPLTSVGEFDSRDPALGLMLGGVDLRWDMSNFPVDDQLIANYRGNTPGSRRSPYDLENTAQYALVDRFRNNAYGILGWSESGGPVGVLALDHDTRVLASAALSKELAPGSTLRVGVEGVHHDMQHYAFLLTTTAFSDVWLAKPTEQALLVDWSWNTEGWAIDLGTRIDRFNAGGSHPFLLDTVSSSATFGQYQYFPRISSYGKNDPTLQHFVPYAAHTALAPHFRLTGALTNGVVLRLGAARTARMPDIGLLLQGENTDVAITNSDQVFGSDLGHEIIDLYEVGLSRSFGALRLDATLFDDEFRKVVAASLTAAYDPARGMNNDFAVTRLFRGGSYRGVSLGADWKAASWLEARGAYTYADTSAAGDPYFFPLGPLGDFRRHTLALSALLTAPESSPLRGAGALVSYRRMSGAATAVDPALFSPIPEPLGIAITEGLPAWSSLDLRVARTFTLAAQRLTVYVDARNLFNAANLIRAFPGGDPINFGNHQAIEWANDSSAFADEAKRNSLYSPAGDIDLSFGGAGRGGCGAWTTSDGQSSPPNCAYLVAAEQRFGDGDGVFTLAEQQRASHSYYLTQFGRNAFTGPGRTIRIGAQVAF